MGSVPPAGIRSRELPWCPTPVQSPNMDTTLATSLMDLWNTPGVSEKLEETARVYFANSILTVNLIPALLVGVLLLFLLPLFGFPLLDKHLGGGGGGASYGSNLEISDGYGAPSASNSYDAPASNSYDAPVSNSYDTPSSGYDAGRRKRSLDIPSEAKDLYSDLKSKGWTSDQPFDDLSGPHLSVDHAFAPASSPLAATLPLLN